MMYLKPPEELCSNRRSFHAERAEWLTTFVQTAGIKKVFLNRYIPQKGRITAKAKDAILYLKDCGYFKEVSSNARIAHALVAAIPLAGRKKVQRKPKPTWSMPKWRRYTPARYPR